MYWTSFWKCIPCRLIPLIKPVQGDNSKELTESANLENLVVSHWRLLPLHSVCSVNHPCHLTKLDKKPHSAATPQWLAAKRSSVDSFLPKLFENSICAKVHTTVYQNNGRSLFPFVHQMCLLQCISRTQNILHRLWALQKAKARESHCCLRQSILGTVFY